MKTKSLLFGCLAVFVLSLSACSQPAPVSDTASAIYSETDNLLYESETESVASVSTYVFAVTDTSGRTVTDSKGGMVTAVETFPPAATTSTNPSALSRQTVVHTMPGAPSTDGTTARAAEQHDPLPVPKQPRHRRPQPLPAPQRSSRWKPFRSRNLPAPGIRPMTFRRFTLNASVRSNGWDWCGRTGCGRILWGYRGQIRTIRLCIPIFPKNST